MNKTKEVFQKEYDGSLDGFNVWDVRYKAEVVSRFVRKHCPENSVLDAGCGFGVTLDLLSDDFPHRVGCDLFVPKNKRYLFVKQDLNAAEDLTAEFWWLPATDVVVCSHVLQYVEYPGTVFSKLVEQRPEHLVLVLPLNRKAPESGMIHEFNEDLVEQWAKIEHYEVKQTFYFGGVYHQLCKSLLAAHSYINGRKYSRRELADTAFRKALLWLLLRFRFIDYFLSVFEKRSALFWMVKKDGPNGSV